MAAGSLLAFVGQRAAGYAPLSPPAEDTIAEVLERAPSANKRALLIGYLREEAARILGLSASQYIDERQPLLSLGLDSLMAVEFRNRLASALKTPLSATLLFDYPTFASLAAFLLPAEAGGAAQVCVMAFPKSASGTLRASSQSRSPGDRASETNIVTMLPATQIEGTLACETSPIRDSQPTRASSADREQPNRSHRSGWHGLALSAAAINPDLHPGGPLARGVDAVSEVPPGRWPIERYYDPDPRRRRADVHQAWSLFWRMSPGLTRVFSASLPREAASLDPQHRLFALPKWHGRRLGKLRDRARRNWGGSAAGVFLALSNRRLLAACVLPGLTKSTLTRAPGITSGHWLAGRISPTRSDCRARAWSWIRPVRALWSRCTWPAPGLRSGELPHGPGWGCQPDPFPRDPHQLFEVPHDGGRREV